MKIYLAAQWRKRDEMDTIACKLENAGHVVTARWLWEIHNDPAKAAARDLYDIDRADTLVLFSAGPRGTLFSGGGRCIEFGYALALRKRLVLIGASESVFHELPFVLKFPSIDDFIERFSNASSD